PRRTRSSRHRAINKVPQSGLACAGPIAHGDCILADPTVNPSRRSCVVPIWIEPFVDGGHVRHAIGRLLLRGKQQDPAVSQDLETKFPEYETQRCQLARTVPLTQCKA